MQRGIFAFLSYFIVEPPLMRTLKRHFAHEALPTLDTPLPSRHRPLPALPSGGEQAEAADSEAGADVLCVDREYIVV